MIRILLNLRAPFFGRLPHIWRRRAYIVTISSSKDSAQWWNHIGNLPVEKIGSSVVFDAFWCFLGILEFKGRLTVKVPAFVGLYQSHKGYTWTVARFNSCCTASRLSKTKEYKFVKFDPCKPTVWEEGGDEGKKGMEKTGRFVCKQSSTRLWWVFVPDAPISFGIHNSIIFLDATWHMFLNWWNICRHIVFEYLVISYYLKTHFFQKLWSLKLYQSHVVPNGWTTTGMNRFFSVNDDGDVVTRDGQPGEQGEPKDLRRLFLLEDFCFVNMLSSVCVCIIISLYVIYHIMIYIVWLHYSWHWYTKYAAFCNTLTLVYDVRCLISGCDSSDIRPKHMIYRVSCDVWYHVM